MAPKTLLAPERREDDLETSLRPLSLAEFTGQRAARANLQVYIDSAKARGDALDQVLFVGPPGLGKTTLAQIVARELGVNFRSTSGPAAAGPSGPLRWSELVVGQRQEWRSGYANRKSASVIWTGSLKLSNRVIVPKFDVMAVWNSSLTMVRS